MGNSVTGTNAADRVIDILELLVEHPKGMRLSEVAGTLSLAKSATHRLLTTLVDRRLVERSPGNEEYRLGLKLAAMGFRYVSQHGLLEVCKPVLDRLASDTGEMIRMALADQHGLTWVTKSQGSRFGLRYDPDMGSEVVLHSTSSGRAWLATLPPEEAYALVKARGLAVPDRFGRQTVSTMEDLEKELERTRRRGYGMTVEEVEAGTAAVAMAITLSNHRRSVGTVSVLGPIVRMTPLTIEAIVPKLAETVRELSELWPILEMNGSDAAL